MFFSYFDMACADTTAADKNISKCIEHLFVLVIALDVICRVRTAANCFVFSTLVLPQELASSFLPLIVTPERALTGIDSID